MKKVTIKIGGMGCEHCKRKIEEYLNGKGVETKVYLEHSNASIKYDDTKLTLEDIKKYIEDVGYDYLGVE